MSDDAPLSTAPGFAPSPPWGEGWGEGRGGRRVNELAALFREIEQTRMAGVPVLNRALRVEAIGFEPFDDPAPAPAPVCASAPISARTEPVFPIVLSLSKEVPAPNHSTAAAAARMPVPARTEPVEVPAPGHSAAATTHPATTHAFGILLTPWFMNLVLLPLTRVDIVPTADTRQIRRIGTTLFEFLASHEPAIGAFDACSLFSPVFEFPDQASAVATARAVLMTLRAQPATPHAAAIAELAEPAEANPRPPAADAPPARRAFFRAIASGRSAPAP